MNFLFNFTVKNPPISHKNCNFQALLKTEDPLGEAAKFCHNIHTFGTQKVTGYALCAEVYRRKGKVLLALKCLNEGEDREPTHPLLHVQKVKFLAYCTFFSGWKLMKNG